MASEGEDEVTAQAQARNAETAALPADAELRTFLIADVRGYTSFTQTRGDEAAARLAGQFAIVTRQVVAEYGGDVLELRGDEALCVFVSPRQALRAAIALQRRYVEETRHDRDLPMPVGIGLDVGEAVPVQGGYRGGALNLAARLCSIAKPGEVIASAELTHLARTIDGLVYVPLRVVQLKGIAQPVRSVRVTPVGADPAHELVTLGAIPAKPGAARHGPSWLPDAVRRQPTTHLAVAGLTVLVLVASVVVATTRASGGSRLAAFNEDVAGIVDASNGHLQSQVRLTAAPTAVTFGAGSIWTANADGTVSRIDPQSHDVVQTIDVQTEPSAIIVSGTAVWVANGASGTVTRIDTAHGRVTATVRVRSGPSALAAGAGAIWVANTDDGSVSRIDPDTASVTRTISIGGAPSSVAVAGSTLWVADSSSNAVTRLDLKTFATIQSTQVGHDPRTLSVVGNSLWLVNGLDGTVSRIDLATGNLTATVNVGGQPTGIAATGHALWVSTTGPNQVVEVSARNDSAGRRVHTGSAPVSLVAAGHKVWVAAQVNASLHRGGTLTVNGDDFTSIDPTYLNTVPVVLTLIPPSYDGLVTFRRVSGVAGTVLVPDLATAIPTPQNDGRTYVFQLRSGIKFSTGAALTASDVRTGIERWIAANAGFSGLESIVGASTCTPKRCDLATGVTADDASGRVTIRLTHADAHFLYNLPVAVAVPKGTPIKNQGAHVIPGTGPYMFTDVHLHKQVTLARNPNFHEWSSAAQPAGFPNQIVYDVNLSASRKPSTDAVMNGEADIADARGGEPVAKLKQEFGDRMFVSPSQTTHMVMLNTRIAPFNNLFARQALAFAIDRSAVVDNWFTPGEVACQFLPPGFPAHESYCPYTLHPDDQGDWSAPDITRARKLIDRSGTTGAKVTVYTTPNLIAGMQPVVQAMNDLGYHATLRSMPGDYFSFISNSKNKVQAAFSGWVPGSPTPADYLPTYRCSAFIPNSDLNQNQAGFCDKSVDRDIATALHLDVTTPARAQKTWAAVDHRLVDLTPWIPLVNPTWVDVVSPRIHNYVRSTEVGPLYDQMWVQ
jgi:peptide/nickel transport system substrate-binding protein